MRYLIGFIGVFVVVGVLWEVFETIILPRRVTRRLRLTRAMYLLTWWPWAGIARRIRNNRQREKLLSFYGPLSLMFLLAIWAVGLLIGFALIHWAAGTTFGTSISLSGIWVDLYYSGTTFFTLGLGDITPTNNAGRAITVAQAGVGIGFFAMIISYLPVLYQGFSRREVNISLLDARAGSPPSAGELLLRHVDDMAGLDMLLRDWERWAAELMESHLSYPVLLYFRSQHEHQSWLGSLTAILDASALVMVGIDGGPARQAQLTFAMARHAVVDLAQATGIAPRAPDPDRLPPEDFRSLRSHLIENGVALKEGAMAETALVAFRGLYEPFVASLAARLHLTLPPWRAPVDEADNWRTSAWETGSSRITGLSRHDLGEHRDL